MVASVLEELDGLLNEEERALVSIDLETVVALAGRKSELVQQVEDELAEDSKNLSAPAIELARSVHQKAHRNRFLLKHLRGCLKIVTPAASTGQTYGRDGRTTAATPGGTVRARL